MKLREEQSAAVKRQEQSDHFLAGTWLRFDEVWWRCYTEPERGFEDSVQGVQVSLFDSKGSVLEGFTLEGIPEGSTGLRIPLAARQCEFISWKGADDGSREDCRRETVPVKAFAFGHWVRLGKKLVRDGRIFLAKAMWFATRKSIWLCPGLVRFWFSGVWKEFVKAAEKEGPRSLWNSELSNFDRYRIWMYIVAGNNQIGKLYQYQTKKKPVFDEFPNLDINEVILPKLTVVTPSYNQGRFIGATMDSVLRSNADSLDYIVMDGGSRDESAEVIRAREGRLKHWQSKPDKGQAAAIREGFVHTECGPDDVMAYLNSDDLFAPGAVEYVLRWFALNPEIDAVYGHRIIIDEHGLEVGRWILPPHDPEVLGVVDFVPQETLFWRRRIHDLVGGFDPSFQFAMDWDFLLRIRNAGAKIERLPWFLGCFRVHSSQKTHLNIESVGAAEVELLRRRENGGVALNGRALHDVVVMTQVESSWYAEKIREGKRL